MAMNDLADKLVTIFGGGGFLGRYISAALLHRGARLRIAERNPKNAQHIKPHANLGQVQFASADITRPETLDRVVAGSDAVINLVGILNGRFDAVQAKGAAHVAAAAARAGARAMVHMSAIGADAASSSAYGRSKGEGEAAVFAAFPSATIMRPSIVFGREDAFVNKFAQMIVSFPIIPVISGQTRFQPVYVGDVAAAVAAVLSDPAAHGGRTFELGGPEIISMRALNERIAQLAHRRKHFVAVPGFAARLLSLIPGGPITGDQLKMLAQDNVVGDAMPGLAELGVAPTPLGAVAPGWMDQYRPHGRFGRYNSAKRV
jgi:NADH dehydrogenase